MRVGMIGTGAISSKHAEAYRNIGYRVVACTDANAARGESFAVQNGSKFVRSVEELCSHPEVDYIDLCTPPSYRLPVLELCASSGKHLLVQKPIAIDLVTAHKMNLIADRAGIQLGVVSQHRFDDSVLFLKTALEEGRLGRIIQADAYVKWYRSAEYYSSPVKGSWAGEGGGALINQAIHQVDLLLHLVGDIDEVSAFWQLGAVHRIESEDAISALLRYACGATGVIQASTAVWPGYPERLEIHGTKGTAIIAGDKLTTWDVEGREGEAVPIITDAASGASDPMAISVVPFERQLLDFGEACRTGRRPSSSGKEGFRALELVQGIYRSCREGRSVSLQAERVRSA